MIALLLKACLFLSITSSPADTTLVKARTALEAGRPWVATRILAPLLADSARRTPEAVLLAATAASGWSGWPEVYSLLAKEPWLDARYGGEGRRLFVRAALARGGADSIAVAGAIRGLERAPDSIAADLLVLLARGLERLEARDSAAAAYQRAADRLPAVADWLRLRAIAVTDDSARRAALAARLTDSLVRTRVPWAMASAREASGDLVGAAVAYLGLGARARGLRLRLEAQAAVTPPDSATLAAIRRELLAWIRERPDAGELREAVALLDSAFAPLSAAEQLAVAQSAGAVLPGRAVEGYREALAAGLGDADDQFNYAAALFRLGRYPAAASQFAKVTEPRRLAGEAAYQRARALVRDGQMSEGRSALHEVARRFAADSAAASIALYLLADLATDRQEDAEARSLFRRVAAEYPSSRFAPAAAFRAAIIAYTAEDFSEAAEELDALVRRYPSDEETVPAIYWAGRALAAAGDNAAAVARWSTVVTRDPMSYYAGLSARRLGQAPPAPAPAADTFVSVPEVDAVIRRAALLERLGLGPEARREYQRIAGLGGRAPERLLAAADALRRAGRASDAIRLAHSAVRRGAAADARVYRLLYPVVHRDALLAEAAEQQLDPSFVAALVRQESHFNPAATSPAGARGLMQIMPRVGAGLARAHGYPMWDPVLLYQPDVSLQLGVSHLRELVDRYAAPVEVLAAYNAGASRVDRWKQKHGMADPELFAERIPYVETRDYVRIIQRSEALYRALYP